MEPEQLPPVGRLDSGLLPQLAPGAVERRFAGRYAALGNLPGVCVEGVAMLADEQDEVVRIEDDDPGCRAGEMDDAVDARAAVGPVDLVVPDR